ncbi:Uncharacterized protein PBTT_01362 [Plasmodiophora brassicae]
MPLLRASHGFGYVCPSFPHTGIDVVAASDDEHGWMQEPVYATLTELHSASQALLCARPSVPQTVSEGDDGWQVHEQGPAFATAAPEHSARQLFLYVTPSDPHT